VCVCVGFNSHSLPILCWLLVCFQRVGGVTKLDRPFHLGVFCRHYLNRCKNELRVRSTNGS
jgi:hypothetical protein